MIRIYISHCIRGMKGKDATHADMFANNNRAIEFEKFLAARFQGIEFYVPGKHDEFVLIAFQEKFLDETEILAIDCKIVDRCEAVLAYIPEQYISNGMLIEIMHAQRTGRTVLFAKDETGAEEVMNNFLERLKT